MVKNNDNQPVTERGFAQGLKGLERKLIDRLCSRDDVKLLIEQSEKGIDVRAQKYRDQILTKFDIFLKEILDSRQERVFINDRLSDHEERITNLESVPLIDKRVSSH